MAASNPAFMGRVRLILLLLAVILPASLGPPAGAGSAKHEIVAAGGPFYLFRWDPSELEIAVSDRVVWKNPTDTFHHMTPYDGPWKNKETEHLDAEGGRTSFRFKKPGVYLFRCDRPMHSELIGGGCFGQCGEITVSR